MRKYFDPHYKPDRTPSKYEADKRHDEQHSAQISLIVSEFLAGWKPSRGRVTNAAAMMKALRVEAGRKLDRLGKSKRGRSKTAPQKGLEGKARPAKKQRATLPRLRRHGSLRYLDFSDEAILLEYQNTCLKIDGWRHERSEAIDTKRKAVLASQVQVQLEKRADLATLIGLRALEMFD